MSASALIGTAPLSSAAVDELSSLEALFHPQRRLLAALDRHRRLDGRQLSSARPLSVSLCDVVKCDSAAVASVGDSSLLCTCRLEVAAPLTASPHCGFVSVDCHLSPLCRVDSADFAFGRPSALSAAVSARLHSLLRGSLRLDDLSIQPHTAAWLLHVDVVVTSYDGALLDAALLAAHTALAALTLPEWELTEAGEVLLLAAAGATTSRGRPLPMHGRVVCSTFAAVGRHLLLDPSADELEVSDATASVSIDSDGRLVDVWKAGGAVLSRDELEHCIALAKQTSGKQLRAIHEALQPHRTTSPSETEYSIYSLGA